MENKELKRTITRIQFQLETARSNYASLCRSISEDFSNEGPAWSTSDSVQRVLIERTKVEMLEDFLKHLEFIRTSDPTVQLVDVKD